MKKFFVYSLEVLFLLIVGLVPLLWYKEGFMALGHDMGFPLAPVDHFLDRLYTWTDRLGPFGSNAIQVLPGVFIHGLEALLYSLGLSLLTVQKITYIFWFVLPGITMYVFLRYLHPEKQDFPIRISGSLFYMMNHYLLQGWVIAERTKFSIVAALPLVVLLIIKVLHKKESPVKNSMLLALTLFFLNGGEGIPLLISLFVVAITTTIIFFFLSDESFWPKTKRVLVFSLLSVIFWILLSGYWLYPYLQSYNQTFGQRFETFGTAGIISWSQGISVDTSWINLFKLQGIPGWYNNPEHPFTNEFSKNPLLIFLSFLLPALGLIGLLNLKNLKGLLFKARICFLGLLLVAVPLSAGSHSPLGIFYDYLLVNIPGFGMFRSGFFKFGMIIWFAYAYLIAVGLKDIIDWLKTRPFLIQKKYIPITLLTSFVIMTFIYNYPFLTGNFFNWAKDRSTMVKVPAYVSKAKEELDTDKFSTRTFLIPNADLRTEYIEYDWGYFSLVVLQNSLSRKSYIINDVLTRPNEEDLIEGVLSEYVQFGSSNLIKYTGADKAIVQNDFISPDYEGNPLSGITESFKKSQDFTFRNNIERWDFYDYNRESLPRVYSPSKVTFISSLGDDLDLVADLPGALDGDGYLWSEDLDQNGKEGIFDKFIIQARCADCPPAESYQIYFSTSKVLIPGTAFYELGKFITNVKKHLAGSPNARLEVNLSASTTLISDLGSLQAKSDEKGIKVAVKDIKENLEEVRVNLEEIPDSKLKKEILKKIRFFLSFFLTYESQWANAAQPGSIKSELVALERELKKSIVEIEEMIGQPRLEEDGKTYKYTLDVSQTGSYKIFLNAPSSLKDTIELTMNNKIVHANKLNPNWYEVDNVSLEVPSVSLQISKENVETRPVMFAEFVTNPSDSISPNIEFVALNQTKYLVKIKGSGNFVLGFNSRFDPNWSLRELNLDVSNYFKGNTKSFQNGKVVEYERQDRHVLTDIIFPTYGSRFYPTLELNSISSGWVMNTETLNQNNEHVYLLEYNNQNVFYRAAGVSLATFILISGFYYLRYGKNKN